MKITLATLLHLALGFGFVLVPHHYTQAIWQQINTSPFSIKSDPILPSGGPRQIAYSPNGSFLAVANALTPLINYKKGRYTLLPIQTYIRNKKTS